jgi:hypothetical protein
MLVFCRKYLSAFFVFAILLCNTVFAQAPTLQTLVDSNEILIGGQFHLKLTTTFSANEYATKWVVIPDSLPHFEVVATAKSDSINTYNGITTLSQTFTLTSFDSGKWNLPVFRIDFRRLKDHAKIGLFTDSLPVTVSFSVADTTTALKDIKSVYQVSVDYPVGYWVVGGLILLLIIGLCFWAYRYWKNKPTAVSPVSKLAAFEQAIKALEALNQYHLSAPEQVKIYHTQLVDILKKYLSATTNTNHFNKSSSDILMLLKSYALDKEGIGKVATSLRCSDAVKFAKYLPLAEDSIANKLSIKDIIITLNKITTTPGPISNTQL